MDYTKADCWSVAEAAILICGLTPIFENGAVSTLEPLPPIRAGQPDRIKELRNLAYRALDTGDLPPVGKRKLGQVRPADFLSWAESKGYPAPEALRTAFLGGAKTQPPSEPDQAEDETDAPLPGKGQCH